MTRTVCILQSNYIPWKGYFDLIHLADEFVLYDHVQYTRHDWRNRNKIKTSAGVSWLAIPVHSDGAAPVRVCDTRVADSRWATKHWKTLQQYYSKCAGFSHYAERFERLYAECADQPLLSQINRRFLVAICELLGIETRFSWSTDYSLATGKTQCLVDLCQQLGGTQYLTGPSARAYLDEAEFARAGIAVRYMEYSGYREYPQRFGPFEHGVSIVDLLFNTGPDARAYLKTA